MVLVSSRDSGCFRTIAGFADCTAGALGFKADATLVLADVEANVATRGRVVSLGFGLVVAVERVESVVLVAGFVVVAAAEMLDLKLSRLIPLTTLPLLILAELATETSGVGFGLAKVGKGFAVKEEVALLEIFDVGCHLTAV